MGESFKGRKLDIFLGRHIDIHEAIINNNRARVEEILRNPLSSEPTASASSRGRPGALSWKLSV